MHRLFLAGFAAAAIQVLAVSLVTLGGIASIRYGLVDATILLNESGSTYLLLTWVYLLSALGVALSGSRFVSVTGERIRHASRLFYSREPEIGSRVLLVLFCIGAVGFAVLALRPPPGFVIEGFQSLGSAKSACVAWPAMMSVGAAAFGANAQSVRRIL